MQTPFIEKCRNSKAYPAPESRDPKRRPKRKKADINRKKLRREKFNRE